MKRNILILFAVVSLIICLTGCGGSGHSNSVAPAPTTMTSVKVSLTQNGQAATDADVALYTPAAAMREGLTQAQNNAASRASIGLNTTEGVYKPTSTSDDGTYTFNVPTGEYTLIANKGTARAVVTDIRAAAGISEEQEQISVADLKATGKITGKVVADANYGITTAGVMVYLKGTSCVAITNSDGSFEISGVPEGDYFISATTCQNGCYYSASLTSVSMGKELLKTLDSDLSLKEVKNSEASVTVTGTILDANNAKVPNILVLATNEENLLVSTTGQTGTFTLNLKKNDSYTVYVHGSKESSQDVQIDANGNVKITLDGTTLSSLKFTMYSGTTSSYGCVKGKIKFSDTFIALLNGEEEMKDIDRYLVRLIGSSTTQTYYSTQTRADFKYSTDKDKTEVSYNFDCIPEGTYSVFVDPAGNGFLGSVGNVVVTSGKTTEAGLVSVNFVKPVFEANINGTVLKVTEIYPFMKDSANETLPSSKVNIVARIVGSDISSYEPFQYDTEDGYNLITQKGQKCEIIITRTWEDPNVTGLSGALTGTQIVECTSDTSYLGNIIVNNVNDQNEGFISITYNEGSFLGLDTDYQQYLKKDKTSAFNFYETEYTIEKFSGVSGVYQGPELTYWYINDVTDENAVPSQIDIPVSYSAADTHNIDIIANNCISVGIKDSVYIYNYRGGNYSLSSTNYTGLTNLNSAYLAKSPNKKCYVAALLWDNSSSIVKIYEVGNNTECASYEFSESTGVLDFKALIDGSFYIELGDSSGIKSAVRLTSTGNNEESKILSRKSCLMDKQGFMYRYDSITKKVIKTATLDGEPIGTYGENDVTLNGILGLEEDSGSSTLFVW